MTIGNDFKQAIADAFYDKEIFLVSAESVVDDDGWARDDATVSEESFAGNVRFDRLAQLQEEYGIDSKIDVVITCPADTEISANDIVSYSSQYYRLIQVIPFDSHKMLVGMKWLSKSSTSPSA